MRVICVFADMYTMLFVIVFGLSQAIAQDPKVYRTVDDKLAVNVPLNNKNAARHNGIINTKK